MSFIQFKEGFRHNLYTIADHFKPAIALVDCNNFYASCERVFSLIWRTSRLWCFNNDGCVIARSNEAKQP